MNRLQTIRRAAFATVALAAAHLAAPSVAQAQTTLYACYIPSTGSTYRIKAPNTPSECTKSTHVQFSWVDGAGAVRIPYSTSVNTTSTLLSLQNTGSGIAGQFLANSANGVFARSLTATGVHGATYSTNGGGAGVKAEALLTGGTALEVRSGAIRVTGAGLDTPTAVFKTLVGCSEVVLDHPMLNGNPNAFVFSTARNTDGDDMPLAVAAWYSSSKARWVIKTSNTPVSDYCLQSHVSILIIKA